MEVIVFYISSGFSVRLVQYISSKLYSDKFGINYWTLRIRKSSVGSSHTESAVKTVSNRFQVLYFRDENKIFMSIEKKNHLTNSRHQISL